MKDAILISACGGRSSELRRISHHVVAAAESRPVLLSSRAWQVLGPVLDGADVHHYEGPPARRIALGGIALAVVLRDDAATEDTATLLRACLGNRTRLAICADGAIAMLDQLAAPRLAIA
jgi:hypothetical protein